MIEPLAKAASTAHLEEASLGQDHGVGQCGAPGADQVSAAVPQFEVPQGSVPSTAGFLRPRLSTGGLSVLWGFRSSYPPSPITT